MSAQPKNETAPDLVDIEIDGKPLRAPKGSMIIQAADAAGIPIPRFCYHKKLAIAANCRQCLVEVEQGGKPMPKPQPACATPVAPGMKVLTRSDKAMRWQRDVMEFLLINHPLDCPICDQGGECELQDVSMGYGRSVSRFTERKRTVADEDLGPLVATEMTRCIQCTRCVRFSAEIAGTHELGGMGRGEMLEIGTYIGKSIVSELSGNIVDVCPVGALTNKPFRFRARAWELIARPSLGYHDALGSNLWLHTRRGEVLRCVPRDNEAINECWLSDRDRYSCEGLHAQDRALRPAIRRDGEWVDVDWNDALAFVATKLKAYQGVDIGALVHPATSCEEGVLLKRIVQSLGSGNIDHRLRALDLSDGAAAAPFEMPLAQLEQANAVLLVGCDPRSEAPLLNHRLRQAGKRGAKIFAINPVHFDFNYPLAGETVVAPQHLADAIAAWDATEAAQSLRQGNAVVIFGHAAAQHPQAATLRARARAIAQATGAAFNAIPDGANAVGLAQLGILPDGDGLDARAMLQEPRKACIVYGAEPPHDFADGAQAMRALRASDCVIAFGAFASAALREVADAILPIGLLPEVDACMVNVDGSVQVAGAGATPPGESRAGWRVLRALGGMLGVPGFDFTDIAQMRAAMLPQPAAGTRELPGVGRTQPDYARKPLGSAGFETPTGRAAGGAPVRFGNVPIYRVDAVTRRAAPLQEHPLNRAPALRLNTEDAQALQLQHGARASVDGVELPVVVDAAVPRGCAWIEAAHDLTATLPPNGSPLNITKAVAT
ncbi:MAG: NADH-quinone oxidoreductase subunit G [Proteobacteria bacterium]|nr:NADH-quinone oxidoreductase subunit G [Pseudomonadota bacterium]